MRFKETAGMSLVLINIIRTAKNLPVCSQGMFFYFNIYLQGIFRKNSPVFRSQIFFSSIQIFLQGRGHLLKKIAQFLSSQIFFFDYSNIFTGQRASAQKNSPVFLFPNIFTVEDSGLIKNMTRRLDDYLLLIYN